MNRLQTLVVAALLSSPMPGLAQTVYHVDDDAPPGGDGLSWASAFDSLQDATFNASAGDEVRVAGGSYRPDVGAAVTLLDRGASFRLRSNMTVAGGYRGLAAGGSPDDRDLVAFETVLTGDLLGDDPLQGDNSFNVFFVNVPGTLDGISIEAGHAAGFTFQTDRGGGLHHAAGALTLVDVTIRDCLGRFGGGLYSGGSTLTVTRGSISGCLGVVEGCGAFLEVPSAQFSDFDLLGNDVTTGSVLGGGARVAAGTVVFDECTIRDNLADTGGGLYVRDAVRVELLDCSIELNEAISGVGGGVFAWDSAIVAQGSSFESNVSNGGGAGIGTNNAASLQISDCDFIDNFAQGDGGGVLVSSGTDTAIDGCLFDGNRSGGGGGAGVAVYHTATIERCVFIDNHGDFGTVRLANSQWPTPIVFRHNTVFGNTSNQPAAVVQDGLITSLVSNSILWENGGQAQANQVGVNLGSVSVDYCDIQGWDGSLGGMGNFDADPLFFDELQPDLHLRPGSPCIDAGDPAAPLDPDGSRADVGAFPYDPTYCGTPRSYCTAGTSASGCQGLLGFAGTASASAPSGFVLSAVGLEGAKDGLFFFGSNGEQASPWGNGTSFQCVVPPVSRGGLLVGTGTPGACDGALAQDLNALWCPGCPKPAKNPGPGATVQAQLWYRDPLNTSNQTTSLSDAITFFVCP